MTFISIYQLSCFLGHPVVPEDSLKLLSPSYNCCMWEQYRPNLRREDTHIQPSIFHYCSRPRTTSMAYSEILHVWAMKTRWWTKHTDWHQMMDTMRTWLQEDRRRRWKRCTTSLVRYQSRSKHSMPPCREVQALVSSSPSSPRW